MKPGILFLTIGTLAIGTDLFIIGGILPYVAEAFSISDSVAGYIVTVFAISYAVIGPLAALKTKLIPKRSLLLLSMAIFIVGELFSAISSSFGVLLIARIIAAVGASVYTPVTFAVAVMLVPDEKRGRALSLVSGGLIISMAIAVPMGTWISLLFGWRFTYLFIAVIGIIAETGLFFVLEKTPGNRLHSMPEGVYSSLFYPKFLAATLSYAFWGMAIFSIFPFLSLIITGNLHLQPFDVGYILMFFGAGSFIGLIFGGYTTDRFGHGRTTKISVLLSIMAAILSWILLMDNSPLFIASYFLFGMVMQAYMPSQLRRIILISEEKVHQIALSINNSMLYTGLALGAVVGGVILKHFSVTQLPAISVVFISLTLILSVFSWGSQKPSLISRQNMNNCHTSHQSNLDK